MMFPLVHVIVTLLPYGVNDPHEWSVCSVPADPTEII